MNINPNLTSGRLLARNTLLNVAGEAAPFLVAIFAIPVLVHTIGVDRYGVLTLATMVVGYFGVFDFGLGRAATKFISEAAATGNRERIPGLFWTSLWMMFGFGICGGAVLAALSPWLVSHALKIPLAMRGESLDAFYLMALSLPFTISGGSLNGTLSAFQRFDLINALRVPVGILSFLAPLMVLPFSHYLGWLVAALVIVRAGSWAAGFVMCVSVVPELRREARPHRAMVRPLLGFGGWVAISATIGPVVEYADRFAIGAMLSVAAVTYYAVPFQVTGKLRTLPAAMSGVIFPAFSALFARDKPRAAMLFGRATRYLLFALFPAVLLIVALAPELLGFWMGPSFARRGTTVMRWLAVGVLFNSVAWMPSALIQGADRPDLITKLRILEVPFFFTTLWWTLSHYGVVGAAITWTVRSIIETVILFLVVGHLLPEAGASIPRLGLTACAMTAALIAACVPVSLVVKAAFLAVTLGAFAGLSWSLLLDREEKENAVSYFRAHGVPGFGIAK